jgi:hypothetical protein
MKWEVTDNLKHHTVSLQTWSIAAAERRAIEMARRADNDSRPGIRSVSRTQACSGKDWM